MVNNDLRNFAKSSTNLDQIEGILASGGVGSGDDHQGTRSLKKDNRGVLFKEEPAGDDRSQARIAVDDDVDSVQHLDLSVIDDNHHDGLT